MKYVARVDWLRRRVVAEAGFPRLALPKALYPSTTSILYCCTSLHRLLKNLSGVVLHDIESREQFGDACV